MRTTNNLFRKVHNYIHFMGWLTQFERKCNILEIFHYFQYFERFLSMKKWQISKPKIVDWYLDFTKESCTTLKSIISCLKICFQNYGQLKRKFLTPKNTSSTFLKFELSSLSAPMLKTRENTIRNQFEQQWFDYQLSETKTCLSSDLVYFKTVCSQERQIYAVNSCQVHESRKFVKEQSAIINQINFKNHNVFASRNWILPNRTMPMSVCFIP